MLSLWGISTPNFWLGIMLIFLFAVTLGWLPASGYVSPWEDWRQSLATTIMPAFVLGNAIAGVIMRHTRSAMLQALQSDYVRTARAKGLEERSVVLKHAMRNALTPVITLGALEFGTLLSGAVLTEQIFTIPGFGKLIVDAVFNRDYAVVQGVVLVTATTYITLNLLADVGYILVNPRLREPDGARLVPPSRCDAGRREPSPSTRRRPRARLAAACARRRRGAMVGLAVIILVILVAAFAPLVAPYDPAAQSWSAVRKAPSARLLARHRRGRARPPLAHHLRRPRLAARPA